MMRYQNGMPGTVLPGSSAHPRFSHSEVAEGNSQILGYLGRALSLEFSAGQHYLAQASLAKFRNEMAYAELFIGLANEEFQHANQITDRMVAQGALPAGSVLAPATPATNIVEALRTCEMREIALVQLYGEAAHYCHNMGAAEDYSLFSKLLEEEQAQLAKVNQWLEEYYYSLMMNQHPQRGAL